MEDINSWESKFEFCSYSTKLLEKIESLNKQVRQKVDINEVKKAIYYARKYHSTQMRQSGEPYYSHPLEVAYMFAEYTASEANKYYKTDLVVTSILHDTIEDTVLTEGVILDIFGRKVASQVEDLTRVKAYGKISSAEIIKNLFLQEKHAVAIIKLFDRIHNLKNLGIKSPEKARKIIEETATYFIVLALYLESPIIKQQIIDLCYQNMDIKWSPPQKKGLIFQDNFRLPSLIL